MVEICKHREFKASGRLGDDGCALQVWTGGAAMRGRTPAALRAARSERARGDLRATLSAEPLRRAWEAACVGEAVRSPSPLAEGLPVK